MRRLRRVSCAVAGGFGPHGVLILLRALGRLLSHSAVGCRSCPGHVAPAESVLATASACHVTGHRRGRETMRHARWRGLGRHGASVPLNEPPCSTQRFCQETVDSLRKAAEFTKPRRKPWRAGPIMYHKLTVRGLYRLAWKRNIGHASRRPSRRQAGLATWHVMEGLGLRQTWDASGAFCRAVLRWRLFLESRAPVRGVRGPPGPSVAPLHSSTVFLLVGSGGLGASCYPQCVAECRMTSTQRSLPLGA